MCLFLDGPGGVAIGQAGNKVMHCTYTYDETNRFEPQCHMHDPLGLQKCPMSSLRRATYRWPPWRPASPAPWWSSLQQDPEDAHVSIAHTHLSRFHHEMARGGVLCVRTFVQPVSYVLCDGDGHELRLLGQEHHAARQLLSQVTPPSPRIHTYTSATKLQRRTCRVGHPCRACGLTGP